MMVTCLRPPGRVIIPSGPGRCTPAGARTGAASGGQAFAQAQCVVQPVVRFVLDKTCVNFRRKPVGLRRLGVAVILFQRLHLQCRLIGEPPRELECPLRLIDIEPRQRRIATDHALLVIERGTVRIGIELLASALKPAFSGARKFLTQPDRKFGEVIPADAKRLWGVDRQLFESAG